MRRNGRGPAGSRKKPFIVVGALVVVGFLAVAGILVATGGFGNGQAKDLTVAWTAQKDGLSIRGTGFRPRSSVSVRVGSLAPTEAQADSEGIVSVDLPVDSSELGDSGVGVIVSGRASSGAARALVAEATTAGGEATSVDPETDLGIGPLQVAGLGVAGALLVWLVLNRFRQRSAGRPRPFPTS